MSYCSSSSFIIDSQTSAKKISKDLLASFERKRDLLRIDNVFEVFLLEYVETLASFVWSIKLNKGKKSLKSLDETLPYKFGSNGLASGMIKVVVKSYRF